MDTCDLLIVGGGINGTAIARDAAGRGLSVILAEMNDAGYWAKPGPGYNPKYRASVWSVILLAQLGALVAVDERIEQACSYLLDQSLTTKGQFSASGAPNPMYIIFRIAGDIVINH